MANAYDWPNKCCSKYFNTLAHVNSHKISYYLNSFYGLGNTGTENLNVLPKSRSC